MKHHTTLSAPARLLVLLLLAVGAMASSPASAMLNFGCTSLWACNYDPAATTDDGSCEYASCLGCTYAEALNFDPQAAIDDGSCVFEAVVTGCTAADATNYNPQANQDDGSCSFPQPILGCIYPQADNYLPEADRDNGNCIFNLCEDPACLGDLNDDGVVNSSDLSIFLSAFGTFCD